MKRILAVLAIAIIAGGTWYVGYSYTNDVWYGLFWVLAAMIVSGVGAFIGMYIIDAVRR